jgi:hypothetical protein
LVFFLPLGGYWLLAILTAFHPRALWVVAILGPPLVLVGLAVVASLRVEHDVSCIADARFGIALHPTLPLGQT